MSGLRNKNSTELAPYGTAKKKIVNITSGTNAGEVVVYEQLDPISDTVSQATSISTGVTINSKKGIITTQASTLAGAGSSPDTFVVTNSKVTAGSNVIAYLINYSGTVGTNGNPFVNCYSVSAGSFSVVIMNGHATNALNGILKIGFEVKN